MPKESLELLHVCGDDEIVAIRALIEAIPDCLESGEGLTQAFLGIGHFRMTLDEVVATVAEYVDIFFQVMSPLPQVPEGVSIERVYVQCTLEIGEFWSDEGRLSVYPLALLHTPDGPCTDGPYGMHITRCDNRFGITGDTPALLRLYPGREYEGE